MSKIKRMRSSRKNRDRMRQGLIIGETFDYLDPDTLEVTELETIEILAQGKSIFSSKCHEDCFFRDKNPVYQAFIEGVDKIKKEISELSATKGNGSIDGKIRTKIANLTKEKNRYERAIRSSQYQTHANVVYPCCLYGCHLQFEKTDADGKKCKKSVFYKKITKEKE